MRSDVLSPRLRRLVGFCFTATFVVITAYLAFFLAVVAGEIGGLLEQDDQLLTPWTYVAGLLILAFGVVMAVYAIGYVVHLWKEGLRREALNALVMLVFLNALTGYVWFYRVEIKGQKIWAELI